MNGIDEFGLVRIDDRLIHGQVVAVWCKHKRFTHIVIVDDSVAQDTFMQDVLRLAAPPGLQVHVLSLQQAGSVLNRPTWPRATTMVLVRSPLMARQLFDSGVRFGALNVGALGAAPGRRKVFKNISASDEEIGILQSLADQDVEITFLTVPGEETQSFRNLAGRR